MPAEYQITDLSNNRATSSHATIDTACAEAVTTLAGCRKVKLWRWDRLDDTACVLAGCWPMSFGEVRERSKRKPCVLSAKFFQGTRLVDGSGGEPIAEYIYDHDGESLDSWADRMFSLHGWGCAIYYVDGVSSTSRSRSRESLGWASVDTSTEDPERFDGLS